MGDQPSKAELEREALAQVDTWEEFVILGVCTSVALAAIRRAVTELHVSFKMLRSVERADVFLNSLSKFWRISRPTKHVATAASPRHVLGRYNR